MQIRRRSLQVEDAHTETRGRNGSTTGIEIGFDSKTPDYAYDVKAVSESDNDTDDSSEGGTFGKTAGFSQYYAPKDNYEGRHRYDPTFQWEKKEEDRLVRLVCSAGASMPSPSLNDSDSNRLISASCASLA